MIFDGEIAAGPATSPTLYLSSGQTDHFGRLVVSQDGKGVRNRFLTRLEMTLRPHRRPKRQHNGS